MPLPELFEHPLAQALALALVHFVWQGAVVALVLVAVVELFRLRRPQARYLCSLVALLVMVACPLVTLVVGTAATDKEVVASIREGEAPTEPRSAYQGPDARAINLITTARPYVLGAWLAGVAFFGCRLLMGLVGVRQLRRHKLPLPRELAERVEQLGRRLGMRARSMVFLSRRVGEAMAVGLVRPLVLLPAAWATEMPLSMLEAVIAHELAHLHRRDLWVVLLERVVETLLFYHPAVWWLSSRLRAERELCCDELAVALTGRRLEYVQALETVARRGVRVEPLLAAGFRGERNMQLLGRVRNVLGLSAGSKSSRLWPAGVVALLLPLAAWAWSAGLVTPQPSVAVADDDDGDDDDKPAAKRVERDDDEKEVRKERAKERDDDGDGDEKKVRKEGERKEARKDDDGDDDEKGVRKDGERKEARKDDDGDEKEVRKLGVKEIRKDGDKPVKIAPKDGDKPVKVAPKDGDKPVKIAPKDGEKKTIKIAPKDGEKPVKEGAGKLEELAAMVKKLSAENAELRAALAEARRGKLGLSIKEKEGAIRDKEAFIKKAAAEKEAAAKRAISEKEAITDKKAFKRAIAEKEAVGHEKEAAAKRAAAEKEEAAARDRKETILRKEKLKEGGERSEAEIIEHKLLEKKKAEAADREAKEKEKEKDKQ
jgi:bla regulator protein blaR1